MTLGYLVVRVIPPTNFAESWIGGNQTPNRQSEVGKLPEIETAPKDVLALRREHQLRPLSELENGTQIQGIPNGVYGFSMCSLISLRPRRGNTSSLEIHKHHDGIVYYVGYASDDDVGKYLARPKNFHILLFPHPWEKAPSLFEIPVDFVSKCEERPLGDAYVFDLFVTSIPELQS